MKKEELLELAGPDLGPILRTAAWIPDDFDASYIVEHDAQRDRPYLAETFLLVGAEILMILVEGNGDGSVAVRRLSLGKVAEVSGEWTLDGDPRRFDIRLTTDEVITLPITAQDARATAAKAQEFVDSVVIVLRKQPSG